MSPASIHSHFRAERAPLPTASSSHQQQPLGSALPLLSTILATLLVALLFILLAAEGSPLSSQTSNLLLA
jgi:hypothetical protein